MVMAGAGLQFLAARCLTVSGDFPTLLWSEIKDTVDFTKLIVDSSGNFPNLTTAQTNTAQTIQDVIDIKNSTTSSFITNRHPGDFLLESDAGNTTQSIINGGKFNLSGPDTKITLNGARRHLEPCLM